MAENMLGSRDCKMGQDCFDAKVIVDRADCLLLIMDVAGDGEADDEDEDDDEDTPNDLNCFCC